MASLKVIFSQIVLCALLAVTGIDGKFKHFRAHTERTEEKEFPYLVALTHAGHHLCSGVIIDSTHILTAGHCVQGSDVDFEEMVVVSGSTNIDKGNHHRVKSFKAHDDFSMELDNSIDMAIITLHEPIEFNEYQKAVKLQGYNAPRNMRATSDTGVDFPMYSGGWGFLWQHNGDATTELWKINMQIMTQNDCMLTHPALHDGQVCAKPKKGSALCLGDSGSPLVEDGVLIGVASIVVFCGEHYPDVFTRVDHYLDWIEKAIKN